MDFNNALHLSRLLDCVATGIFTIDMQQNITFFNKEAEEITGYSREEALSRKCYDVFRTPSCYGNCCLKIALKYGRQQAKGRSTALVNFNKEVPIVFKASLLRDEKGTIIGWVESFFDDSARAALEKKINESYKFNDIIGRSSKIMKLFEILPVIANSDPSILITGETGTGKDIFARSIYNTSPRNNGPFVKVNCAALPDHLLESEMFGYKKGAFTDAKENKPGLFKMADGGTIFLDEIGDLPLPLQGKLLQVLDEKEFFPLGSVRPIKVDVRVIASTNQNLQKMVQTNLFRKDLYYRLRVIEIEIPPLRERPEDILILMHHFITEIAGINLKEIPKISHKVNKILLNYSFPGNVRELKNIVEHAMLLCVDGKIKIDNLPSYLLNGYEVSSPDFSPTHLDSSQGYLLVKEKEGILEVLENHRWHMQKTANALHINRTTLWRKMKKYDLNLHGMNKIAV